uniref:Dirigent protein n=1 Tax=Arundo donax TaxID=35708 RepID=A0A0A9GLY3_ARUDO
MHDITGGPGQTAVQLIRGTVPPHPSSSSDTVDIDDHLTEGPAIDSKPVGRPQGTYMLGSLHQPVFVISITFVLTDGPYNGSTIVVAGRENIFETVRELAVVGGTGQLRRAAGHVLWRTAKLESAVHMVLELDVHASVPANAAARGHWSVANATEQSNGNTSADSD